MWLLQVIATMNIKLLHHENENFKLLVNIHEYLCVFLNIPILTFTVNDKTLEILRNMKF